MLITTTPILEGQRILRYHGIVSGETVYGANVFKDLFASVRNIVGGRTQSYEGILKEARDAAINDMAAEAMRLGANAIIGVDIDYAGLGQGGSMLMVVATGTAVTVG